MGKGEQGMGKGGSRFEVVVGKDLGKGPSAAWRVRRC